MASSIISEEILPKDVLSDLVSERESSNIFMVDKDVMIPSRRSEMIQTDTWRETTDDRQYDCKQKEDIHSAQAHLES